MKPNEQLTGVVRAWLAATVLFAAAFPAPAAMVWIEAERPAASNFPPPEENPFAPRAFWEEDLLSDGKWIGRWRKEGEEAAWLEYEFEAPAAGNYSLYARKFYGFGNFRWRVDDGEWREVASPRLVPLDAVHFGDEKTRIALQWFYMGGVPLTGGRHRLRVEPLEGVTPSTLPGQDPLPGVPMAYDVFLLTTQPFFPAGKLAPGERLASRSRDTLPFQPPIDAFAESPIDWRGLNEPVAGADGGITIKGGQFVSARSGREVRLLGVNLDRAPYASPGALAYLARTLAKRGINVLRVDVGTIFEVIEEGGGPVLRVHEDSLADLSALVAALKGEGIYTALTWNLSGVSGVRKLLGGGADDPFTMAPPDASYWVVFDKAVGQAVADGWRAVLGAPLPGGGTLGSDPAVFLLTLGQQISLFGAVAAGETQPPEALQAAVREEFRAWLVKRYGSVESAVEAWKQVGENVTGDPLAIPPAAQLAEAAKPRAGDITRFLAGAQRVWMEKLADKIRTGTGYRGLVSFSNRQPPRPDVLGLASAWASAPADLTERGGLYSGYYEPTFNIWSIYAGARFRDRSALRFDALPGLENERFDLPLNLPRFSDKPSALTEVAWLRPNRYSGEMPLLAATLATLQDVRFLAFLGLNTFHWAPSLPATRLTAFTPATLGQFPAIAYAFREGLLPGPRLAAQWDVTEDEVFSLAPAPVREAADAMPLLKPLPLQRPAEAPAPTIFAAGRVEVRMGAKESRLTVDPQAAAGLPGAMVESSSGDVVWDTTSGLLRVDAPQFQALAGFLGGAGPLSTAQMEFVSPMDFGVLCLVALDGQPLEFSSKMLLQVFSTEGNTGELSEGGDVKVLRAAGRPPLALAPLRGRFALQRPDAAEILVTALDPNGYPVLPVGHAADLQLLPATLYYLLEK